MQHAVVKKFGSGGVHVTLTKDSFNIGDKVIVYAEAEVINGTHIAPTATGGDEKVLEAILSTKSDINALNERLSKLTVVPGNVVKQTPTVGEHDVCCECGTPATRMSIDKVTGTERKLCPVCN